MKRIIKNLVKLFGYSLVPNGTLAMDVRQLTNVPYYFALMQMIAHVPGAVVECGVGKGRTFLYFAHFIARENKGRELWGFDSFKGFPEPTPEDASERNPQKGEWGGTSSTDITRMLRVAGLSQSFITNQVKLIPGYVEDTLAQYSGDPIALLHIDLDLYSGYKHTLETLVPYVSEGGLVVFDEYGEGNWPGATQAVDEFLSTNLWKLETHPISGKKFFVKSKNQLPQ